jgi:hypothetical protein
MDLFWLLVFGEEFGALSTFLWITGKRTSNTVYHGSKVLLVIVGDAQFYIRLR